MGKKIDQENLSELNTQLVQEETPETSTEKKLLFTDYSIGRFQGNFLDKDNKRKVRIYKSFDSKNTPKGISIHEMNEKIDSGNLIYRKKIHFKKNINSFKSTYKILLYELEKLFIKKINMILNKNYKTKKLLDIKSSYVKGDLPKYIKNWDISISQAKRLYKLSKKNIL